MTDRVRCQNCGAQGGFIGESPDPQFCGSCPPHVCDGCGQLDSMLKPCSCWVSLASMPLADIKGIFARDGAFSIGGLR